MDTDMGKNQGDKEYHLANQSKNNCKKRQFQGIHDRFLRDQEFRIRMIEHHREEEVCRRWDALADEDHTHHLTQQAYFHCKNKWWFHSNEETFVPSYSYKHKQWQLAQSSSSTWWNWQGSWWSSYNSEGQGGGGGQKKIFQYCPDSSGTILYLRALQGHSGRNLIDPSLQDNVVIPSDFFQYMKKHSCPVIPTSTNNGSWHRVHLLHGGIGKAPGGLLTIQKVKEEVSQVLSMHEVSVTLRL